MKDRPMSQRSEVVPNPGPDAPVTERDLLALTPDAVVVFAADCVETACRFFQCGSVHYEAGHLLDAIRTIIRLARGNPSGMKSLHEAKEVVDRGADWIRMKSQTDTHPKDSRYEGIGDEVSPTVPYEYDTLEWICCTASALGATVAAFLGSRSPIRSALSTVRCLENTVDAYLNTIYWNDDRIRAVARIPGEIRFEIRSHLVKAALRL
jgi:hypothetical protein